MNPEEIRLNVEENIMRFLDIGRQLEAQFLHKRLLLSVNHPDQILKEVSSSCLFYNALYSLLAGFLVL